MSRYITQTDIGGSVLITNTLVPTSNPSSGFFVRNTSHALGRFLRAVSVERAYTPLNLIGSGTLIYSKDGSYFKI